MVQYCFHRRLRHRQLEHVQLLRRQIAQLRHNRQIDPEQRLKTRHIVTQLMRLVDNPHRLHQHRFNCLVNRLLKIVRCRRIEQEVPRRPTHHPIKRLLDGHLKVLIDHRTINPTIAQVDATLRPRRRRHKQTARLLRRTNQLQQIRQRQLVDHTRQNARLRPTMRRVPLHRYAIRTRRRQPRRLTHIFNASLAHERSPHRRRWRLTRVVFLIHQLDYRRSNQNAVALLELAFRYLLAVDKGTIRTSKVLDRYLIVRRRYLRMMTTHHVLDEHHLQLATATDDQLLIHLERKFTTLVFARNKTQDISTLS